MTLHNGVAYSWSKHLTHRSHHTIVCEGRRPLDSSILSTKNFIWRQSRNKVWILFHFHATVQKFCQVGGQRYKKRSSWARMNPKHVFPVKVTHILTSGDPPPPSYHTGEAASDPGRKRQWKQLAGAQTWRRWRFPSPGALTCIAHSAYPRSISQPPSDTWTKGSGHQHGPHYTVTHTHQPCPSIKYIVLTSFILFNI